MSMYVYLFTVQVPSFDLSPGGSPGASSSDSADGSPKTTSGGSSEGSPVLLDE